LSLEKLTQTNSVAEYAFEFQKNLLQIKGMDTKTILFKFVNGLQSAIKAQVMLRNPKTLTEAIEAATVVDQTLFASYYNKVNTFNKNSNNNNKGKFPPRPPSQPTTSESTQSAPMEINTMNPWLKKLTPQEKQQLKKEGKCFQCRQPGHLFFNCPKPKQNIHLINQSTEAPKASQQQ
jgi:hypothetical protein